MELFLIKCLVVQRVKQNTPSSHYIRDEKTKQKLLGLMAVLWLGQAENIRLAGQEEKPLSPERSGSVPLEETPGKVVCRRTELLKRYEVYLNEPKMTDNCIQSCLLWMTVRATSRLSTGLFSRMAYTQPAKEGCQKWRTILLQQPPLGLKRNVLNVQQGISAGVVTAPLGAQCRVVDVHQGMAPQQLN